MATSRINKANKKAHDQHVKAQKEYNAVNNAKEVIDEVDELFELIDLQATVNKAQYLNRRLTFLERKGFDTRMHEDEVTIQFLSPKGEWTNATVANVRVALNNSYQEVKASYLKAEIKAKAIYAQGKKAVLAAIEKAREVIAGIIQGCAQFARDLIAAFKKLFNKEAKAS